MKCGASNSTLKLISNSINNKNTNKIFQNEFINDPAVANSCYNVIVDKFIKPLITTPYHQMYVNDNDPFGQPMTKKQLEEYQYDSLFLNKNIFYIFIPVDHYGTKFSTYKYFDSSYVNVPWMKTFIGKRRAARWLTTPSDMIKWYFSRFGIEDRWFFRLLNYPVSYVFPIFKKIKTFCHNNFDNYSAALRIFVDLETISGIFPMKYRMSQDDPYKWLTELVKSEYDRNWWCQQFYQSFVDAAVRMPDAVLTLKEYVLSPWLWVTPGASKFSKLYLEDEYVRTKFGLAVSTTDEEKLRWLNDARYGINGQRIDIFPKHDETGPKLRYIANCQIGLYWIAGYILYLIRAYCGMSPKFSKLSPTYDDKIELIDLLRNNRLMLPLDESSYDYHVTRDSWLGFIDFLEYTFPNNEGVLYFKDMFNNATWVFDNQTNKWLKGMPSGLALTSILNSWMNYIKQKTIVPGNLQWAAGDDALVAPFDYVTLSEVELKYKEFGSQTNATKNWISHRYGEYLKSLYGVTGSSGYPARVYGTLLFAQDMSYVSPANRLNEIASLWKLFYDRGGLHMDENVVAIDLANSISNRVSGFNSKIAKQWLHCPKIHGGFGKYPYNNKTFTWLTPIKKVKHYRNSRYRLPPVIEDWGKPELIVGTYKLQSNVAIHLGPKLKLPPILTEDDWVKSLNRENIPDRGPFTDMQLDTVPLPVVDFISFVNMANFADRGGFNVLPNLSGSWNTIASRLVLLSEKLLDYAFESLNSHNISIFV